MPVIIPREQDGAWQEDDTPERQLRAMLVPLPTDRLLARAANPVMNKATVGVQEWLEVAPTT